jgi:hypothetical protein
MQADFSLTNRVEFSIWLSWGQPGFGVTTILNSAIKVVSVNLLFFGMALTVWPR